MQKREQDAIRRVGDDVAEVETGEGIRSEFAYRGRGPSDLEFIYGQDTSQNVLSGEQRDQNAPGSTTGKEDRSCGGYVRPYAAIFEPTWCNTSTDSSPWT